jgi:hypothetical protein
MTMDPSRRGGYVDPRMSSPERPCPRARHIAVARPLRGRRTRSARRAGSAPGLAPAGPRALALAIALAIGVGTAGLAAADTTPTEDEEVLDRPSRALHFRGVVGLATPYGFAGGEVELAGRILAMSGGVGGGRAGGQLAAMVRARTPSRYLFFDAGLGFSGGAFSKDSLYLCIIGCNREPSPVRTAYWTNVELGAGLYLGPLHARLSLGVSRLENPGTFTEDSVVLPYIGVAAGGTLPL